MTMWCGAPCTSSGLDGLGCMSVLQHPGWCCGPTACLHVCTWPWPPVQMCSSPAAASAGQGVQGWLLTHLEVARRAWAGHASCCLHHHKPFAAATAAGCILERERAQLRSCGSHHLCIRHGPALSGCCYVGADGLAPCIQCPEGAASHCMVRGAAGSRRVEVLHVVLKTWGRGTHVRYEARIGVYRVACLQRFDVQQLVLHGKAGANCNSPCEWQHSGRRGDVYHEVKAHW
jgi:hypothetical protein